MNAQSGKPARPVYHCTICGQALPWDGGRIRLVCGQTHCHGDLPRPAPISVREGDDEDRIAMLVSSHRFFGAEDIHTHGKVFDLSRSAFLVVEFDDERAGFLAYELQFPKKGEGTVVLLVVKPKFQGRGVGKALQGALEAVCRPKGIHLLHVSTSNDNIPSLYFYQRLGFRIEGISLGAAAAALEAHGEKRMLGFGGIAIRDEIRLVKELSRIVESA